MGKKCRYDGSDSFNMQLIEELGSYIDVCPELLGGFGMPRPPCEITEGDAKDVLEGKGKISDINGKDITADMLKGAELALEYCKNNGVRRAYLKKNSPRVVVGKYMNHAASRQ